MNSKIWLKYGWLLQFLADIRLNCWINKTIVDSRFRHPGARFTISILGSFSLSSVCLKLMQWFRLLCCFLAAAEFMWCAINSSLCKNMTLSAQLEVHNVLLRLQRSTTVTVSMVKFGCLFLRYASDQTDKRTHSSQYISPLPCNWLARIMHCKMCS